MQKHSPPPRPPPTATPPSSTPPPPTPPSAPVPASGKAPFENVAPRPRPRTQKEGLQARHGRPRDVLLVLQRPPSRGGGGEVRRGGRRPKGERAAGTSGAPPTSIPAGRRATSKKRRRRRGGRRSINCPPASFTCGATAPTASGPSRSSDPSIPAPAFWSASECTSPSPTPPIWVARGANPAPCSRRTSQKWTSRCPA